MALKTLATCNIVAKANIKGGVQFGSKLRLDENTGGGKIIITSRRNEAVLFSYNELVLVTFKSKSCIC